MGVPVLQHLVLQSTLHKDQDTCLGSLTMEGTVSVNQKPDPVEDAPSRGRGFGMK